MTVRIACGLAGKLEDPFEILDRDQATEVPRFIGAMQPISIGADSCNFKPGNQELEARIRTDPVFLAGEIRYGDLVRDEVHVTQFGHRMVITDFGKDNRIASISATTEPDGGHNRADDECPGYRRRDDHFTSRLLRAFEAFLD
jgi:hypothetical protein